VSYRQSPVLREGLFLDTMEVAAPWSKLGALHEAVRAALGQDAFVMAHFSHAYPDGCCIYFTFVGSSGGGRQRDVRAENTYDAIWARALTAAHAAGGSIAHHHGVGRAKAPALDRELGPGSDQVLAALKRAFDPDGIMNPGVLAHVPRPDPFSPRARPLGKGEA
jgi:alkyldihydroxyacetonephosphate synthase